MTDVTIKCPITWYTQCEWIETNCTNWVDKTCWAAWQIGFDYIHYELDDEDALLFRLKFGHE